MHPDLVFEALLATTSNPRRAKNLRALHGICTTQAATTRDFSLATLRKIADAQSAFNGRILYNKSSRPLVDLIRSWKAYRPGQHLIPQVEEELGPHSKLLLLIGDPALRSLLQAKLVEYERQRAELRLLKSIATVTVDLRPRMPLLQSENVGRPAPKLTASEKAALKAAISPEFLTSQGWSLGVHGEVRNTIGRQLFCAGYATAIRKILNSH